LRETFCMIDQKPFSSEYKFMGSFGYSHDGPKVNHIKGAPEIIIEKCNQIHATDSENYIELNTTKAKEILSEIEAFEQRGHRALCFAYKYDCGNFESTDYIFLGYITIYDPLRAEVKEAIRWSEEAGIDVKVISGDAWNTTQCISEDAGICKILDSDHLHLTGEVFRNMSDIEVLACCNKIKIISRAKPEDKKRFVNLLQQAQHIVAVTGDGINDAQALKTADVGLSMGSGTDLAQEASKIVIINDSFYSIMNGVKWGRSLYNNIQRFILFQLTINVATLTIAMLGPFIGLEIPLTAVQLLWINLIMDTFGALALATEPPNPDVMKQKPRDSNAFIISKEMTRQILSDSVAFVAVLLFYLFYSGLNNPDSLNPADLARKESIFFTLFVLLNFWNLFNAKTFGMRKSVFNGLFANRGFIVVACTIFIGQILMIQFGGGFFRTIPISFLDWLMVIGLTSIVLWFGEIKRFFARRYQR